MMVNKLVNEAIARELSARHDDDLVQCDSCSKLVPEEETTHGFAYGLEGTFCAECRGEVPDKDYVQGAVSAYLQDRSENR